mmetsp:Transcript_26689/g.61557  ORF Transcript_26689/g.61557 Transcript_26689/m.61557 type:complete len:374 (-) Transcript_26689:467-1588(-)
MPHPAQASSAERSTFKMKRAQAPVFKTGFPAVAAANLSRTGRSTFAQRSSHTMSAAHELPPPPGPCLGTNPPTPSPLPPPRGATRPAESAELTEPAEFSREPAEPAEPSEPARGLGAGVSSVVIIAGRVDEALVFRIGSGLSRSRHPYPRADETRDLLLWREKGRGVASRSPGLSATLFPSVPLSFAAWLGSGDTGAVPLPAPLVSAAPVYAALVSAAPVTAAPVPAAPVPAGPVSTAPVFKAPVSDAPVSSLRLPSGSSPNLLSGSPVAKEAATRARHGHRGSPRCDGAALSDSLKSVNVRFTAAVAPFGNLGGSGRAQNSARTSLRFGARASEKPALGTHRLNGCLGATFPCVRMSGWFERGVSDCIPRVP